MTPRTEQELLDATIELAMHMRWAVHHDRPARRAGGQWHTAIQGHAGFPDLVLSRGGLTIYRELKGYDKRGRLGKLTPEQRDWGRQLDPTWREHADPDGHPHWPPVIETRIGPVGVPVFAVWTPDDWPLIQAILTAPRTSQRTA